MIDYIINMFKVKQYLLNICMNMNKILDKYMYFVLLYTYWLPFSCILIQSFDNHEHNKARWQGGEYENILNSPVRCVRKYTV